MRRQCAAWQANQTGADQRECSRRDFRAAIGVIFQKSVAAPDRAFLFLRPHLRACHELFGE